MGSNYIHDITSSAISFQQSTSVLDKINNFTAPQQLHMRFILGIETRKCNEQKEIKMQNTCGWPQGIEFGGALPALFFLQMAFKLFKTSSSCV